MLHPGGRQMTEHLLQLAGIVPGVNGSAADLGAGKGESLSVLSAYGFKAEGYDLHPGEGILQGDFLALDVEEESYDLVFSECAFFSSGNPFQAIREASRIVKKDGKILIADIFTLREEELRKQLEEYGLKVLFMEDQTASWKEYIIERLWQNEYTKEVCNSPKNSRYYLLGLERIHHE
ncbi:MAG: methyltransferase domain-containing protein [Solobacterium sp.]|nr:methyltransferase domain-containing protein [Solobacterium sp.]